MRPATIQVLFLLHCAYDLVESATVICRLSSSKFTDSPALNDHWIQFDNKWRKLSSISDFPDSFTCESPGQLEPYNTCDADQEDGIRFTADALQGTSSSSSEVYCCLWFDYY